jgi:signal transduction histidine kinase
VKRLFKINIRQKVLVGLCVFMLGIGALAYISYSNLVRIELKVSLVEIVDDLSNIALEIRRTEKNFLLYGEAASFDENRAYIERAFALLTTIPPTLNLPTVDQPLSGLREILRAYAEVMSTLTTRPGLDAEARKALVERLRENGKQLVERSKAISKYERADILRINHRLRQNLLTSVAVLVLIGLAAFLFMVFKIILPLQGIERSTARIAKGNFEPMPVWNTNDEIQRVMEAMNRMVHELDKRRDQLVQAQKLSSIGTLASGIAHQLNNPLNNISTSCQILMEEARAPGGAGMENGTGGDSDPAAAMAARMLANIEQETMRARDIVRGLLEFSRQQEFSPASIPLREVVERVLRLISSHVPPGIEIVTDVPADLSAVMDLQRMQEALINLLINAVQAIGAPPGEIGVTALRMPGVADEPDSLLISVADTGKGIAQEDLERIFDPFFTTKDVGSGTGLGLFVVYGIVKQHRGRIWAESEPGRGTTFHIELPLTQDG